MARMVDWSCAACAHEEADAFVDVDATRSCPKCSAPMEQVWWRTRQRPGDWDDASAVLVFQNQAGDIRYPGQNTARCPDGYEPVRLRSLRAVESFEREHGVRSEMAWFDKGSGRGHDDYVGGKKLTY